MFEHWPGMEVRLSNHLIRQKLGEKRHSAVGYANGLTGVGDTKTNFKGQ